MENKLPAPLSASFSGAIDRTRIRDPSKNGNSTVIFKVRILFKQCDLNSEIVKEYGRLY